MIRLNSVRKLPISLFISLIFQGHFGTCQMVISPEKRLLSLSIDLDTIKKKVHLQSSSISWLDPNKHPINFPIKEFELELILANGHSLRAPMSSFSVLLNEPFGPVELPTRGMVRTAIYTEEEGIGYRVWNRVTGEMLGEEMLPSPKSPPKIEISGGPGQGLRVMVVGKAVSVDTLWSTDNGKTWKVAIAGGMANESEVNIPTHLLSSKSIARDGTMLVEVKVMVGLRLYRERFQLNGSEQAPKSGSWTRLKGEHPPIPQRALVTGVPEDPK